MKIFLNVSKEEQARRFISRIDTPRKNWKVSSNDLKEREYWDEYMEAFETMINKTSTTHSPWYVVPADHKWYARLLVSRIVKKTLEEIDPQYPPLDEDTKASLAEYRDKLISSLGPDGYREQEKQPKEFADPSLVPAELIQQETLRKQQESDEKLKKAGFKKVRELLAENYMINSMQDIMDAIAAQEDGPEEAPPPTEEDDDELDQSAEEVRKGIQEIDARMEEDNKGE